MRGRGVPFIGER